MLLGQPPSGSHSPHRQPMNHLLNPGRKLASAFEEWRLPLSYSPSAEQEQAWFPSLRLSFCLGNIYIPQICPLLLGTYSDHFLITEPMSQAPTFHTSHTGISSCLGENLGLQKKATANWPKLSHIPPALSRLGINCGQLRNDIVGGNFSFPSWAATFHLAE